MLVVDILMPSLSTPEHHEMIRQTISTLRASEEGILFNVIIIESAKEVVDLGQDETIKFDLPKFNFHHAINQGLKIAKNDWVVIANNDLIFYPGWMTAILECKKNNPKIMSFSPWEPNRHPKYFKDEPLESHYCGYRVSVNLAGWCLVTTKEVLDRITLSEEVAHWFSDNNYADELQAHNLPHALVPASKVVHLEEQTTAMLPNRKELTTGQFKAYRDLKTKGNHLTALEKTFEKNIKSHHLFSYLEGLTEYARQVTSICEIRKKFSHPTLALMYGLAKSNQNQKLLVSVNPNECPTIQGMQQVATVLGIRMDKKIGDSLEVEIPQVDLLFIDTWKDPEHLLKELNLHHQKSNRWIIVHSFPSIPILVENVLSKFIINNSEWSQIDKSCPAGITIFERS